MGFLNIIAPDDPVGRCVYERSTDLAPLIYEGGWPKAGGSQNICTANILKYPLFREKWVPPLRSPRAAFGGCSPHALAGAATSLRSAT